MKWIHQIRQFSQRHPDTVAILALVLLGLLTYLPGLGRLGYYGDDWHVTWGGTLYGPAKILDLHLTDRPLMGLIYAATFALLGNAPIAWHLYILGLRILGAVVVYGIFNEVFRERKYLNAIMSILFLVYPGFLQLPTASAYSNHMLGLLSGFTGLWLTLRAYSQEKRWSRSILLLLSMPALLICFGIMEWMMGMEVILMGIVGMRLSQDFPFKRSWSWLKKLLIWVLPSLFPFLLFYIWRIFFFSSARSVTDVRSLGVSYLQHPMEMLMRLLVEPIRGIWNSLVLAWGVPFYNLSSDVSLTLFLTAFGLALLAVGIFYLLFQSLAESSTPGQNKSGKSDWQLCIAGGIFILAAILPVILGNREIRLSYTFDRYTLLASFGVVMVLGGISSLVLSSRVRSLFYMTLLAVAVMTQLLNTHAFAEFWQAQRQTWWQLAWRAPGLNAGTVLLPYLPHEYRLAESYEIWGPANLIYTSDSPLTLSGEVLNQQTLHWIRSGDSYGKTIRRVEVSMDFTKNLLLSLPSVDSCLHVYGKEYPVISEYDEPIIAYLTPYSSWAQIRPLDSHAQVPPKIFGEEPPHQWCYFYQMASLAYQQQNWSEITRLGDEAQAQGMGPMDEMEWLPFYEAYARLERYDEANQIGEIIRFNKSISEQFCRMYQPKIDTLQSDELFMVMNICPMFAEE
jgi:hypothetical protein